MKLYHGTNKAFDTIDLKKSKPNKDFGRGFYLSSIVLNSETYQLVQDDRAGLYYQNPRYVYDFLENELHEGKVK